MTLQVVSELHFFLWTFKKWNASQQGERTKIDYFYRCSTYVNTLSLVCNAPETCG